MTCVDNQEDAAELHKFRILARNMQPTCQMEPIACDPDQDACVTIVMRMSHEHFWIGAGCDYQKNFRHISCKTESVFTRSIQSGQVFERRTPQQTCVCKLNLCNTVAKRPSGCSLLMYFCILLSSSIITGVFT